MPLQREDRRYTYADWLGWDEDVRAEIIDGALYMMAPPTQKHQEILSELHGQLWQFLKGRPCKIFPAPFGVRLSASEDTVLEPDIVVVCDHSKLDGKVCNGAPDLVLEIMSPSTARYDRMVKFQKYQQAGVPEYWIVDPDTKTGQVCILSGGLYFVTMYAETDIAPVNVLEGCRINLSDVSAE